MSITVNDPFFSGVAAQLDADNPTFLSDVVNEINRSPTLVTEIQTLDATPDQSGGQALVALQTNSGEAADSFYHSDRVNISNEVTYDDTKLPYAGGSLTGSYDPVTSASAFASTIGYELGHWFDANLSPLYNQGLFSHFSVEQATMTEFASEGTSGYDSAAIKKQIDSTLASNPVPSTMANGLALFNPAGSYQKDTDELRLLQTISDPGQAKSFLASSVWNSPIDGGTFLSTYWQSYANVGSKNFLGIDYTKVTGVTVQENAAGLLTGGTMTTATNGYTFSYSGVGQETAAVTDLAGNLLYSETFSDPSGSVYALGRVQTGGSFAADPNAIETVYGSSNRVTDVARQFEVQGTANIVTAQSQGETVTLQGDHNILISAAAQGGTLNVALDGGGSELVLGGNTTSVTGDAGSTTVFGGAGGLTWDAGGGTFVLTGPSTIGGSAQNQTVFTAGGTDFQGGTGYADVIGSTGSDTISAAAGGGWFEGGMGGDNVITGSNSGQGTVLDAGGNGDHLTGGTNGGDYFVAGKGNETLTGGNGVGTNYFFLGSGTDAVTLSANSIVDTGTGVASIFSAGLAQVYGGSGGADTYAANGGTLNVYGYRHGTDHVSGGIASAVDQGGSAVLHMTDGATIILHGVGMA
ncbi:hypothetical protein [Lichenicoccus sp.]|uniref:hypothetical protein n=1 Tax=Lichenicoccus sp. TaxID=2781899 RepID=UPI003D13691B